MDTIPSDAVTSIAGGTMAMVLMIAGVVLAILAILMPIFVYLICHEVQKLRKLAERMHWQVDQIRKDVDRVKQKWGA